MRQLFTTLGLLALVAGTTGSSISYYEESLPSTMNPLFARSMVDRRAHELVFDRLYYRSAVTSEVKSRLVDHHERVDAGLGLKLYLKSGINWHDGVELTADDVCFTIETLLYPESASPLAKVYREVLAGCVYNKKENSATITFTKKFYNPTERLGFSVMPKHVFQGDPNIQPDHEFAVRPIGTGPMKGSKGRREVKFTATPNGHHNAAIGVMSMAEGGDPLVQVRTLLNGGVQGLISVAPPLRSDVASTDDVALKAYQLRSWWFAALNTNRPLLARKEVRQAVDATVDRFELRRLTMGYDPDDIVQPCQFISGPFIPSSSYYNRSVKVRERSDIGKSREMMVATGAVEQHGVWTIDGEAVSLKIGMAAPLDLEARDLLNQIGNQLQSGGFGRQVYKVSADDWSNKAVSGELGDFDILIGKWSFGVVENVSPLFETRKDGKGLMNIFGYSDPKVDELTEAYEAAKTDTEAQDAYHALHVHLAEELPYLFLWKLDTQSAWRLEVRGNTITPYFYFTEFDSWTFSES
ncbi:MAG: hypothetical protein GWP91_17250 [Rhodobacterales bacterium]|nr:hypothetical protein [Rhodobacterales bacterium]